MMLETTLSRYQIGRKGETIVTDLLPGAVHVNANGEKHLPYDITWNNIKIDVKTSSNKMSHRPLFSLNFGQKSQGVNLVFLLIRENKTYFWIDRCSDTTSGTRYLDQAVTSTELPYLIYKIIATPDLPITINGTYRTVSLTHNDYDIIDKARQSWIKKNKIDLSIAKMIRLAVEEYKEKHGI